MTRCVDRGGVPANKIIAFYNAMGVVDFTVGPDYLDFAAALRDGGGILFTRGAHVYLIYGLKGWKHSTAGALMHKYDTADPMGDNPYRRNVKYSLPESFRGVR